MSAPTIFEIAVPEVASVERRTIRSEKLKDEEYVRLTLGDVVEEC